ncbi:hypothetical protein AcW1_009455 [Taiwanofungus camphoratus]|nr:hypothetical protein AcW1_009455 [Antrodia cinnamomea]
MSIVHCIVWNTLSTCPSSLEKTKKFVSNTLESLQLSSRHKGEYDKYSNLRITMSERSWRCLHEAVPG